MQTFELPDYLAKRIAAGRAILFLGAGASVGCRNQLGRHPPLGGELARILSEAISAPFDPQVDSLATVASNAQSILGTREYLALLRQHYNKCTPSAEYLLLTRYYWPRIYTTNIDDGLETAFRQINVHGVEVLTHKSPLISSTQSGDAVQLIKLNGSISHPQDDFIFTTEEYADQMRRLSSWYSEMAEDFSEYTFVFIGTTLNEPLFYWHADHFMRVTGADAGLSFIILPGFSANRRMELERSKLQPLEGTITDFTHALQNQFGLQLTPLQVHKSENPSLDAILKRISSLDLLESVHQSTSLTVVDRSILQRTQKKDPSRIRSFYFGNEPTWRDIIDGVPARLSILSRISKAFASKDSLSLIQGPAGSGKTTLLMMAALEYADANPETLVLWFTRADNLPLDFLRSLDRVILREVLVVIDDVARYADEMQRFLSSNILPRTRFVLADRSAAISRSPSMNALDIASRIKVSRITEDDTTPLLEKLERFGPWHRLGKLPLDQRRQEIYARSGKQLLVALREATLGRGFDQIIGSEYKQIQSGYPQTAFHMIALATSHRLAISARTLRAALNNVGYTRAAGNLPSKLTEGLEDIVISDASTYKARHTTIAEYIVQALADKQSLLVCIKAIVDALGRYAAPLRRSAPGNEARLYAALINHDFLWSTFKLESEAVLQFFREWEVAFEADALFWLQYALFEHKLGMKHLDAAVNHIRIALEIFPDSYQVIHAYAMIHFNVAEQANDAEEALGIMESASMSLEEQCRNPQTEAYALVALARGRIGVLNKWWPKKVTEEWPRLERRLKGLQQSQRQNPEIERALRDIPIMITRARIGARGHRYGVPTDRRGRATPAGTGPK
jgi:SIR2-like domain